MIAVFSVAASLLFGSLGGWIPFQRPASIAGVVTDATGLGLPGAYITIISKDGERRTTVTDFAGQYRIDEIAPGGYTVEASMVGFDTRTAKIGLISGGHNWNGALLVAPPFGEMSIERQVVRAIGSDAADCGRYIAPASDEALQRALTCAIGFAKVRRSFSVIVQFPTGGTYGGEGLLAGPDGLIHLLQYGKGEMSFRLEPCMSPRVNRLHFGCHP